MTEPGSSNADDEIQREAARLNDLLGTIGYHDAALTEWWNWRDHDALRGRTATRAWLDGDHDAVIRLVEGLAQSHDRAGRARRRADFTYAAEESPHVANTTSLEDFRRRYVE